MPATRKRPRPSSPEPGPAQRRRSKKQKKDNGEAVVATDGDAISRSTTKNKASAGRETRRTSRKSVAGTSGTNIGDIEASFTIIARCPRPTKIIHHSTASSSRTKADSKREIKLELEEDMNASASTGPRYYQSNHPDSESKPLPKKVHRPQSRYPDDEQSSVIAGLKAVTNSDLFISKEPYAGKKSKSGEVTRKVGVSREVAQSRVQDWRNSTAMSASTLTPESF
ncbi:hypothetical protein HMN09_00987800 [Mycena chlorophos]|uniref:Uncharacterized protein n=1 Tax=Mycena chlorophos TaxID=658473 RepID=A0A8H6SIX5_MYCCL|nr:hypothetical protein HMN09_00987800 [Mycena chlorophos]